MVLQHESVSKEGLDIPFLCADGHTAVNSEAVLAH